MDQKPKFITIDFSNARPGERRRKNRHRKYIYLGQVTEDGRILGRHEGLSFSGEVVFSRSGNTFYLNGEVFHRYTGSHWSGGNFIRENGDTHWHDCDAFNVSIDEHPDKCKEKWDSWREKSRKDRKEREDRKKSRKSKKPKTRKGNCDCGSTKVIEEPDGKVHCPKCEAVLVESEE